MASEDIVQISDVGRIQVISTTGVITGLNNSGAIASAGGASGFFTLTLNAGDAMPDDELLIQATPFLGETGAGGMASVSFDAATSTDTVKRFNVFADDRAAPINDYAFNIVLSRIINQR